MKVLLLSCNTGEGHNSAAKAVKEQLEILGAQVDMENALAFLSESVSKIVCATHVTMYKHAPSLFGKAYGYLDGHPAEGYSPAYIGNALYASRLMDFILQGGYDAVICTHVFPAEALTRLRRKRKELPFKTYLVATDYTCCPYTNETRMDYYFVPCAPLVPEFRRNGIPEKKLVVTGIPIAARCSETLSRAKARRSLGLPEKGPFILLISGSMGCGPTEEVALSLVRRLPASGRVIILCGNNEKLRQTLLTYGSQKLLPVGYTHRVPAYMDACDVVVTKGGGLTTTEAAAKGLPMVHMDAIPGCETHNVNLFAEEGMSVAEKTVPGAANAAIRLLKDPAARAAQVERQRALINPNAARDIAAFVLSNARVPQSV